MAQVNATELGLHARVRFLHGHWFDAVPGDDEIRRQRSERLGNGTISAAVLERNANMAVRYRAVEANELAPLIAK